MKQQKLTLHNQREDYRKKQAILKRDLEQLVKQKQELQSEKRNDNEPIIRQNNKLQVTISLLRYLTHLPYEYSDITGISFECKTFALMF